MPDVPKDPTTGRATAGQMRRAGFAVEPADTADDATTGFEVLTNHSDAQSVTEFEKAKKRGDHMPKAKS